jgi:hypothetical protein
MIAPRLLRLVAFALVAAAGLTAAADAASLGFATTTAPANLREGPGTNYHVILTLPPGVRIAVAACTSTWCAVNLTKGGGFVYRTLLDFDDTADVDDDDEDALPPKPKPHHQTNDDAQACFFKSSDFSGPSFCASPGDRAEFLPKSFDDAIESILIDPGVSVEVCSDEDLEGNCQTFDKSRSRLPGFLRDEISSYAVQGDDSEDDPVIVDDSGDDNDN